MKNNTAVKLTNVNKRYVVHHEKPTLIERLIDGRDEQFPALKNITLTIKRKDRVGFIGPNGSGKTTLLKIITGITNPTSGRVEVNGKVISLIDLEAGFHPDLTGIQNIFLSGMVIGMTNAEIKEKMNEIIKFANIGKFIDAQLFTYSQGMKLRLGFAVAVYADPDILILDENISVGDQDFSKASYGKIQEFLKEDKTIIMASHNMNFLKRFCKRVVWIENGKIKMKGPTKKIISAYLSSN
jgi:ABC-type polysaccharide/polyol phosphate transport system ATPase subunit